MKKRVLATAKHFAKDIGGAITKVRYAPKRWAAINGCGDNVNVQVESVGGTRELGWLIEAVYVGYRFCGLQARHHAVWRNGDGQLIDVTPQLDDPIEVGSKTIDIVSVFDGKVLFVADDTATWELAADGSCVARETKFWNCEPTSIVERCLA